MYFVVAIVSKTMEFYKKLIAYFKVKSNVKYDELK